MPGLIRLAVLAVASALSGAALAQNTITFSNPTPPVSVSLLPGSLVQIGTSGNLTAQCLLDGSNRCAGLPAGADAPVVALTASTQSVLTGVPVTITAAVSNAHVCERRTGAGSTGAVSGWSGLTAGTGAAAGGEVLPTNVGTYMFELKCWNDGGSTSAVVAIPIFFNEPAFPPAFCSIVTPPTGFTRDQRTDWIQLFPAATATGIANTPPRTGSSLGVPVVLLAGRYLSVSFTTGDAGTLTSGQFRWAERQSGASAELPHATFINFSACAGDFGLRTQPLGAGDIGALPACRSHRVQPEQSIQFADAATANTLGECPLQPNTTYYLNMLWVDPRDGIAPGEYRCQNGAQECGLDFFN